MKRYFRITNYHDEGLERLEMLRDHIRTEGRSCRCPAWRVFNYNEDDSSCPTCKALFPRVTPTRCPCSAYSPSYLIKRLTEIIAYNKRLRKLEKNDETTN